MTDSEIKEILNLIDNLHFKMQPLGNEIYARLKGTGYYQPVEESFNDAQSGLARLKTQLLQNFPHLE